MRKKSKNNKNKSNENLDKCPNKIYRRTKKNTNKTMFFTSEAAEHALLLHLLCNEIKNQNRRGTPRPPPIPTPTRLP